MSAAHAHVEAAPDPALVAEETRRYHHFITLALWLAIITGVEIVAIFIPVSAGLILASLAVLSVVKFFAVMLWFMHLIYDHKLLFWLFTLGLVLATATFTALVLLFSTDRVDSSWFA
jgi:cytochrome c oxidase subunit 4